MTNKANIVGQLYTNGVLQLGIFKEQNDLAPYRLRLEMLPAYPALCHAVAARIAKHLSDEPIDRLVAHADSVAVGSVIAQKLGISLVYSRGRGEAPVFDLVGAYDVGHPSCLVVNVVDNDLQDFVTRCQRVGLDIRKIIAIVSPAQTIANIPVEPLYTLEQIITELHQQQFIPEQQMQSILTHLSQKEIAQPSD